MPIFSPLRFSLLPPPFLLFFAIICAIADAFDDAFAFFGAMMPPPLLSFARFYVLSMIS